MKNKIKKNSYPFLLLISIILTISSFIGHYFWSNTSILAFLAVVMLCVLTSLVIYLLYGYLSPDINDPASLLRRLVRFESLSHPLLLKLSYEAPGTFHHSINVSILAQKAAKAINADAMLIRVAAYYHDIGKLANPIKFIENQSGEEIPKEEDTLFIKESTQNIISHVKNGVEIAKSNNLPPEIIGLIAEHHGTTKVLYFYEKAKEKRLKIKKTDFKYGGPLPQSKEAAILMLSDSIEAATRAIPDLTPQKIREIVSTTFDEKISENQLKKSRLTEENISAIKKSLTATLLSIYHQRILSKKEV